MSSNTRGNCGSDLTPAKLEACLNRGMSTMSNMDIDIDEMQRLLEGSVAGPGIR